MTGQWTSKHIEGGGHKINQTRETGDLKIRNIKRRKK